MLSLLLTPGARAQFDALPEIAAVEVAETLRVLQHLPLRGVQLEDTLGQTYYQKLVIVRRRRWTLHIVYRLESSELVVEYIDPSWVRRPGI